MPAIAPSQHTSAFEEYLERTHVSTALHRAATSEAVAGVRECVRAALKETPAPLGNFIALLSGWRQINFFGRRCHSTVGSSKGRNCVWERGKREGGKIPHEASRLLI